MSFTDLGLSADVLRAVSEQAYKSPTPIQSRAIPAILSGGDVMASAQTGTGKTAAFALPILDRLGSNRQNKKAITRALILTPTRELAAQVHENIRIYGAYLPLRSAVVFGGVGIQPQIAALRRGVDILVATPGRLLDLLDRGVADLNKIEVMVLDEADRMLDMGFMPAINRILQHVPSSRQTLLFSATFAGQVRQLAKSLLQNPEVIETAHRNIATETVSQSFCLVDRAKKYNLLAHLIQSKNLNQALVFTRTKLGADRLAKNLSRNGYSAGSIHGDKSQRIRTRVLRDFKKQTVQILVATDVAARGIDIDRLPHVINYDLPDNPEDYVHRIGRTGRGGEQGKALSLVCHDESDKFQAIERFIKTALSTSTIDGFEPETSFDPRKVRRNPSSRSRHGKGNNRPVVNRRASKSAKFARNEKPARTSSNNKSRQKVHLRRA